LQKKKWDYTRPNPEKMPDPIGIYNNTTETCTLTLAGISLQTQDTGDFIEI
jgi:hypothetical protein